MKKKNQRTNSLLQSEFFSPEDSIIQNHNNGSDAERIAASLLAQACKGEIRWGSRQEDGRKIDLLLSFENPYGKEIIPVLCQVKSGKSYGLMSDDKSKVTLKGLSSIRRVSYPILLIWVSKEYSTLFWHIIHPKSTVNSKQLRVESHKVSPFMRYDLMKTFGAKNNSNKGGKGVTIPIKNISLKEKRAFAKKKYISIKKDGNILNPILGSIQLTKLGWRHMFRYSRPRKFKDSSLNTIPYIEKILSKPPSEIYPTEIITSEQTKSNEVKYCYRDTTYLLKYEDVLIYDHVTPGHKAVTVIFKVVESIVYQADWINNPYASQCIKRVATLKSCYYKLKKA